MSADSFDEPLAEAAADSLRRAAKAARERARQTKVPLVFWKDGRVVYVRVTGSSPKKSCRRKPPM
jgi:hypothetical protein